MSPAFLLSPSGLCQTGRRLDPRTASQLLASNFTEAINSFRSTLLPIPLLVVEAKTEEAEATQLLQICTNYLVGLAMETKRKELPKSNVQEQIRLCEMAAYLTRGQHVDIL